MSKLRQPGIIHTISGKAVNLTDFKAEDVSILDIAWGLGRTLRYGGHMNEDYTVAHHSIIMSYYVPEEYALEALLHDAGEAYIGDIIWPVKALFPAIEHFENSLTWTIMEEFTAQGATYEHPAGREDSEEEVLCYEKSDVVRAADLALLEHECFEIGRAGVFHQDVENAWLEAALTHQEYWYAPMFAYLQRFRELVGVENPHDLRADGTLDELDQVWFKQKPEDVREHNQELIDKIAMEEAAANDRPEDNELDDVLKEFDNAE